MSTAEVTFSVGELASERKQEARKILWALLLALLIHLIVGYVLAILNNTRAIPLEEEDKPVELTIVDTTPVAPKPKNTMFMETDPSRQTAEAPKEKTFESNANSIAASEAAPTGDMPLPSQDGKDRPGLELENQTHTLANQGAPPQAAAPQASAAPQATVRPEETATPVQQATPLPTPAPDAFAMLTKQPTPQPQPSAAAQPAAKTAPQQPSSAYRPERLKTRVGGNISNRGIASVNALGTPLGRYQKFVTDAIGSRWYFLTQSNMDKINIGTLTVHFYVDRSGKIKNLKVLANSSNEAFANVCLQSIMDAKLPPIPDDVAATLPSEGLEWDGISFTMFPNNSY